MLLDLADAARSSGLPVTEVDGWRTRGHGELVAVETIVAHHTATAAAAAGDYPSLGIVRDGRPGLAGPLSQLGLGRDGTVYVIAAGVAYHAGATWSTSQDNWHAIGIEAEHPGGSAPWPPAQYDAYARLCAALCRWYRLDPARVQGHKEIARPAGRKPDPTFSMTEFRGRVADLMQEDDMANYADDLAAIKRDVATLLKRSANSAERERKTNALLRSIRAEVSADRQQQIDALLGED